MSYMEGGDREGRKRKRFEKIKRNIDFFSVDPFFKRRIELKRS